MKKISIYMALAIMGMLASCNKPEIAPDTPAPAGIKVVLTVNDALWTGEGTKTAFTAGEGVAMSGTEHLSLFYDKNDQLNDNIEASPLAGQYAFTMPADAEGCDWYGLMPYSDAFDPASLQFDLTAVQSPGANTFDPAFDLLVAQPFTVAGDAGEKSAEINSFKRLFAPFCLSLSGLGSGEKIYNVSMQLNQAPTVENALAGTFGITMSDSYAGTQATVVDATKSNEVSAVYADGLAAVDGRWPVWFMVNPMTINANCEITVSVTTATNTYTRTVELPTAFTFKTDEVNRLKFNIKGSGYEDITNDYYAQYQAGLDISINGTVFNKAINGAARKIKLYQQANANAVIADYTTNGILFLDYDEADGQTDQLDITAGWVKPTNIVIIGRYRNHQPCLITKMQPKGSEIHLKNVELSLTVPMYTSEVISMLDFNAEDCTIVAGEGHLFYESKPEMGFRSIVINNSIIRIVNALYDVQAYNDTKKTGIPTLTVLNIEKIWLTNCIVYAATTVSYPTFALAPYSGSRWPTPSLDLNIDHCSFYNIVTGNMGIVSLKNVAKFNFNYCVGDAPITAASHSPIAAFVDSMSKLADSTIYHNYFDDSNNNASYNWMVGWSAVTNAVTANYNTFTKNASPFTSTNSSTGYFPINTTVVTGNAAGAGASYNTKYWKTWEE